MPDVFLVEVPVVEVILAAERADAFERIVVIVGSRDDFAGIQILGFEDITARVILIVSAHKACGAALRGKLARFLFGDGVVGRYDKTPVSIVAVETPFIAVVG